MQGLAIGLALATDDAFHRVVDGVLRPTLKERAVNETNFGSKILKQKPPVA